MSKKKETSKRGSEAARAREVPESEEAPGAEVREPTAYEREMESILQEFRDEESLPPGLYHGLWAGQRHYVCSFCDVGYLSLEAAEDHLHRHPQELRELRMEYEAAALAEPEAAPSETHVEEEKPSE